MAFVDIGQKILKGALRLGILIYFLQCITAEHVTTLCRVTADTTCEAIKVKLLSILGYIGKMAAKKDNTQEILKVLSILFMQICILRRLNVLMKVHSIYSYYASLSYRLQLLFENVSLVLASFTVGHSVIWRRSFAWG